MSISLMEASEGLIAQGCPEYVLAYARASDRKVAESSGTCLIHPRIVSDTGSGPSGPTVLQIVRRF